jgi:glutaminyl-peptide cyclotransferase
LPAVSGARALAETAALLEITPRVSGTANALRAAEFLRDRLAAHGVPALIDAFTNPAPGGPVIFRNVLGALPPESAPGETEDAPAWLSRVVRPRGGTVILVSHYDTKEGVGPGFQGANDSGSSTGLLLEMTRAFREAGHASPLLFAFVDGEECRVRYGPADGLHGSRRLARLLSDLGLVRHVRAVIVLDMVGDHDLKLTIPRNSDRDLVRRLFAIAEREGLRRHVSLFRAQILDDHVPFLNLGIPAIDLIDFEYGTKTGLNDLWHTEQDTLDKLDSGSLEIVGRLATALVRDLQPPTVARQP